MAELLQLDAAAALVGKSEVTLRRLIKAGKIPVQKQKTLTGFIYLVDASVVKAYYQNRGEITEEEVAETPVAHSTPEGASEPSSNGHRVAVANAGGTPVEYWQKRAESYEDRYYQEMQKHASAREELGLWRGRAEHAQAMLMKMLPASPDVAVSQQDQPPVPPQPAKKEGGVAGLLTFLTVVVTVSFVAAAGAIIYFIIVRR